MLNQSFNKKKTKEKWLLIFPTGRNDLTNTVNNMKKRENS